MSNILPAFSSKEESEINEKERKNLLILKNRNQNETLYSQKCNYVLKCNYIEKMKSELMSVFTECYIEQIHGLDMLIGGN